MCCGMHKILRFVHSLFIEFVLSKSFFFETFNIAFIFTDVSGSWNGPLYVKSKI